MNYLLRLTLAVLLFSAGSVASAQSFSDVSPDHYAYTAIETLKEVGILQGYSDGTFQPEKSVNRAEAVKIIIAPLLTQEQLAQATTTVYSDVPEGVWYLPYIEWARQAFNIIDGPPAKTAFLGENQVILVEFLKMLELANGVDPHGSFGEVMLPLANDVTNPEEWYYPYVRYAFTASILEVDDAGKVNPAKPLTRADTAMLLYNFLLYQQQGRTQALLDYTEKNILITLQAWDNGLITETEYASARALLTARGAQLIQPDEAITQAVVKAAQAFRSLVRGYRAGAEQNYDEAIDLAGEAYRLADEAISRSADITALATQIKSIAGTMAEGARELKGN